MSQLGWRRRRGTERQLRTERPVPSDELVATISAAAVAAHRHRGGVGSRVAFAAAITTFMLGTFASFGGLSYAASGASTAAQAVERVVVEQVPLVRENSAAADQYGPAVTPPAEEEAAPAEEEAASVAGAEAASVAGAEAASGTLPFTGVSLAMTLLISLGLIGGGVMLRRREQRQ